MAGMQQKIICASCLLLLSILAMPRFLSDVLQRQASVSFPLIQADHIDMRQCHQLCRKREVHLEQPSWQVDAAVLKLHSRRCLCLDFHPTKVPVLSSS